MSNLQAVIEAIKEQGIANQQAQAQTQMDFQYQMLSNEMKRDYKTNKTDATQHKVSMGQLNPRTYHPYKDVRANPISGDAEYRNFVAGHNFSHTITHNDKGLNSLANGTSIQEHNKGVASIFSEKVVKGVKQPSNVKWVDGVKMVGGIPSNEPLSQQGKPPSQTPRVGKPISYTMPDTIQNPHPTPTPSFASIM
tara:strand:+ start:3755 stop:4336 length:582 start_codon:yes stop_codon:yes gene_type:complete